MTIRLLVIVRLLRGLESMNLLVFLSMMEELVRVVLAVNKVLMVEVVLVRLVCVVGELRRRKLWMPG